MAVQIFAAIYIGSYELNLKIFELSPKKKMRAIDDVRSRIELGKEVYRKGTIGYELVEEICQVLQEFSGIMKSYRVEYYEVYASAVFRDAANELFVVDQVFLRTGFQIKVISNSEYRFIGYKSVAGREQFEKMIKSSTAVVDIGGSGIQITLFSQGKLMTTQHIEIGTVRLQGLLMDNSHTFAQYQKEIEEFINKKTDFFRSLYLKDEVEYVIFLNDYCMDLIQKVEKNHQEENVVRSEKFVKYIEKLQKRTIGELCKELNLSNDSDPLIIPSIILFKTMVQNLSGKNVWVPGVNISDGIAYDIAQRNGWIKTSHDFDEDILSAAQNLSWHYDSYSPHIEALNKLSVKIFDTMKKVHGLGKRQRLLLQVATMLHDCGKYVSFSNSSRSGYDIIMASEIIGLTHLEREIVASTVLYNVQPLDPYEELSGRMDKESYLVVAKLSAILRVANALDQSHKQKFENIRITIRERELVITVEAFSDISLEQSLFYSTTSYFENVFSMKPVLKAKRVYRPLPVKEQKK